MPTVLWSIPTRLMHWGVAFPVLLDFAVDGGDDLHNTAGYFAPLLAMIEQGIEQRFIKPKTRELYFVAEDVEAAVNYIRSYVPPIKEDKWFEKSVPSGME